MRLGVVLCFCLAGTVFFTSCLKQKPRYPRNADYQTTELFLAIPKNVVVFEDISGMLYQELWCHFERVRYRLRSHYTGVHRLETKITSLTDTAKLISPDLLTFGFRARMVVHCALYAPDNTVIAEQDFSRYSWISKAKNPVFNRQYLREQYRLMCHDLAPGIDHFVRMHLNKKA